MQVSECAKAASVTPDTVRYYARLGLLKPRGRSINGYRQFSERDVKRIVFIKRARNLGFKLSEVAEIIRMSEARKTPWPSVRQIIHVRVREKDGELKALMALFRRMKRAIKQWKSMPDGVPDGDSICALIEATDDEHAPARDKHRNA